MTRISDGAMDLFGLPLLPERGRGRPAHVWTQENSNKVSLLFACGHQPKDVAAALGITTPTLYKHYFNECERRRIAQLALRARQMERLNAEAEKGNVAAEKALAAMVQAERVAVAAERIKDRPAQQKERQLGKKEAARVAAAEAQGRYAPRTPPPGQSLLDS